MLNYTQISNVSYVDDTAGGRLWARFILISEAFDPINNPKPLGVRQIRGFTNGGIVVFTYWIDPEAEVLIFDNKESSVLMLREKGEPIALGSGVRIEVGDLILHVALEDYDKPMDIRQISVTSCPFGHEVDHEILKYYRAPNYCCTSWATASSVRARTEKLINDSRI